MRKVPLLISLLVSLTASSCYYVGAYSEINKSETDINFNVLADAIHRAENGPNKQGEAYGIHSVHYSSEAEARHICLRTLKHQSRLYGQKKGIKRPFLEYLSTVYCPKHSKRWLHNVTWFYERFLKQEETN